MYKLGQYSENTRTSIIVVGLTSGSHVINHIYLVLFPPVLTVLAADFNVGLGQIGFAMGIGGFVNGIFQIPYGYLADNYDRSLSLALCLGLGTVGVWILALAPSFLWLVIGQIVLGAGIAGHHPAHFSLISDATPEEHRAKAYSIHGVAGNIGFSALPIIIIGITALPGANWRHAFGTLAFIGMIYSIIILYIFKYRVDDKITTPNKASVNDNNSSNNNLSILKKTSDEVRSILNSPGILMLAIVAFLASTMLWGVASYVPALLENSYDVPSNIAGLILSVMFFSGGIMMLLGGRLADKLQPGFVLAAAYIVAGVAVFSLSMMVLPWELAILAAILAGSLGSLGGPARDKLTDLLSARSDLGQNFAIVTIGVMSGNAVAPPLFGTLIEYVGYSSTFVGIGLVAMLTVLMTIILVFRYRDGFDTNVTTALSFRL